MTKRQESPELKKQASPSPLKKEQSAFIRPFPGTSLLYKQTPNALTLLRLIAAPFSVWALVENRISLTFWIFFAASLTDWLDGFLARRWQAHSRLGQILDPLADKALILSLFFTLSLCGYIPFWSTSIVWIRDLLILIVGSKMILTPKKQISLPPHIIGKISTTLQLLFIGVTLMTGEIVPSTPTSSIGSILMVTFLYGVTFVTILSGIVYARVALQAIRSSRHS